jgi:flagellar export protein FliJ
MEFRFSLAAVLNLRKAVERQEFLNLEKINQEIARIKNEFDAAVRQRSDVEQSRNFQLIEGMPSVLLQSLYEQVSAIERHMDSLKAQSLELTAKKDKQIKVYSLARQKREVLDSLRERQYSDYLQEATKRQQTLTDDLFLARLKRK